MFKKVLALVLAVMMVMTAAVAFASCGKKDTADGTQDTQNNTQEPAVELHGESEELLPRLAVTNDVTVPSTFKIGLICLHDENSTYDKNFIDGFTSVVTALGIPAENYFIKTGIDESNDCYDAAIDLVNKGCNIIFADSFGHGSFMAQAAAENPDVQFCHATGTGTSVDTAPANLHNAFAAIYEGRYCAGIAAGLKLNEMIAAGKITAEQAVIGYVGAFTYAEVVSGLTSFYLGARSVCPSVTMKVRYTGSWYDYAAENEAAQALIETDHCVLISQHADSLGAPTACEVAGVPNISYNGSTYSAGESTFIISSAINWAPYFKYIITQFCNNQPIAKDWTGTIATNSVVLSGVNYDVAAAGTIDAINAAIAAFKAGTLHVFDVTKFTVDGAALDTYNADVEDTGDYSHETNVIHDGYFDESNATDFRSAPYFDLIIDGITNLNTNFG